MTAEQLTAEQIAEDEKLCEWLPSGPWDWHIESSDGSFDWPNLNNLPKYGHYVLHSEGGKDIICLGIDRYRWEVMCNSPQALKLLARSRTALPLYAAEVKRLRAELEREKAVKRIFEQSCVDLAGDLADTLYAVDAKKAARATAEANHRAMTEMYAEEKVNADENRKWAEAAEGERDALKAQIREWKTKVAKYSDVDPITATIWACALSNEIRDFDLDAFAMDEGT